MPLPSNKRVALVATLALAVIFLVSSQHSAVVSGLPALASFATSKADDSHSEAPNAPPSISSSTTAAATPSFPNSLPLLHPSERVALPLVEAIANFTLLPSPDQVRINVTVCAVPTHEISYLPEWLVWHRLLGVERFVLFDNFPTRQMRKLLKPWLEEGSVILYEMEYHEGVNVGTVYQQHLLRLCERHILPVTNWAIHHDLDEFLVVDPPGWSSHVPTLNPEAEVGLSAWRYPLHGMLEQLEKARCVPVTRIMFQNVGVRELMMDEMVTEVHTTRERKQANRVTYGKTFLHSNYEANVASWHGPHACKPIGGKSDANVIHDVYDNTLKPKYNVYPSEGLPLPQEGISLNHYAQRSLQDCYNKVEVLLDTPTDWRSVDGLDGCARNYIPSDSELSALKALLAEPQGKELASRPEEWMRVFVGDTRARESWVGRMTRGILDEWRRRAREQGLKGWEWEGDVVAEEVEEDEEEEEDLIGIVRVSV